MISDLLHDLRFAWRTVRKSPWVALAATLSLALGIGANTTIFTLARAFLAPAVPAEEPRHLVSLYTRDGKTAYFLPHSYPNFRDYRRLNTVFVDMLAQLKIPLVVGKGRDAERVMSEIVSGNYFSVLGVQPAPGRGFLPEEDATPGSHPVAVISHGLWQRRFGGDPAVVGSTITLDNHGFTVVGVAPEGFRGTAATVSVDVWVPAMMHAEVMTTYAGVTEKRSVLFFEVIARLKPKVGIKEAQSAMKTIARQLEQEYPDVNKGRTVTLVPLLEATISPNERSVFVLTSAFLQIVVGLVLLIACINLANLLLARAAGRRREIALRAALGATRSQLIRQLLTESLVLALAGGVLGLLFAVWATPFLWALRPPASTPIFLDLAPDSGILVFTFLVSLATGLAFGLPPALRASRPDVVGALKDSTASWGSGRRRFRLSNLLVVGQVAGSLVVLIAAMLFVRSVQKIHTIEPGFSVDDVLVMTIEPSLFGYGETESRQLYRRVVEHARTLPGVRSATLAARLPMAGRKVRTVSPEGHETEGDGKGTLLQVNMIGTDYFETIGIPLEQGRSFTERDVEGATPVAIVNETFAKRYWPGQSPLGKRLKVWERKLDCEVVGVARDSKYSSPVEAPEPFIYLPFEQHDAPVLNLHLRTSGSPAAMADSLRREVQRVDENVSIFDVRTLRQFLTATMWMPRLGAALLGFFGVLGLLLTAIGLYGVLSDAVVQRTREIGVRVALGGQPRHVRGMVLFDGMRLVLAGAAVGMLLSLAVTRSLSRILYGVSTTDPTTFVITAAVLAGVGALATYLPAMGATRVDPMVALRAE